MTISNKRSRHVSVIKPAVLVCGLSIFSWVVQAEPVSLADKVLDTVTAGANESSGSGGAIIGNSSTASINQTGGVTLGDDAQMGAQGLNLVNSAESTVANGVNIWDIDVSDVNAGSGITDVAQSNIINQEQRRSASMPSYSRPEANTIVNIERTGTESHDINLDRDNSIVDTHALTSDAHNTSTAKVDTTIKGGANLGDDTTLRGSVDTNVGKGLAIAGQLDALVDGGEVQIGLAIGGAVIAQPDTITSSTSGPVDSYGGMTVGSETSDFTLYGRLVLPDLTLKINGAGCGVAMGSCESGGTANLESSESIDKSTMDKEISSSVGNSDFVENQSEIYRSPFEMSNAQAEYIVVDESSLDVNTTFTLALSGSAQSNVSGMNVVNATGSAVANGVNVARTSQLADGALALVQSNAISHSR